MAVATVPFTTGPATLPDIGVLSYNGCIFSPLFETYVSGNVVRDNAGRTTRFMEYSISVDGYVTLAAGQSDISPTMTTLRSLLTAQAGALSYTGRGCNIVINTAGPGPVIGGPLPVAGANKQDAAWGPVPELLEFQPLGGGLSAKVKWRVKVRIPEIPPKNVNIGGIASPLIQFNYETSVTYSEDGFSSVSARGTLEIPLTRANVKSRTIPYTVDQFRRYLETPIFDGIDYSRFRPTRREFNVSRDKRILEWNISYEEKPYMDMPPGCTIARGTYNVRPARSGFGLASWLCTLRATYTVRADQPRRLAWLAFLALLRLRMFYSIYGNVPISSATQNPSTPVGSGASTLNNILKALGLNIQAGGIKTLFIPTLKAESSAIKQSNPRKAWLFDFNIDEGIYLDSKTTSFSATWRLVTTFSHILLASGIWRKLPEVNSQGFNLWATSMRDINGSQSWLVNKLDPSRDVIIDFGGP